MNLKEKRAAMILALLFLLLGVMILCVAYYLNNRVNFLNAQLAALNERTMKLKNNQANLEAERENLTGTLDELENYNFKPVSSDIAFYSEIQRAAVENKVSIISSQSVASQSENDKNKNKIGNLSAIAMNLKGSYTNVVNLIAAWRALPFPVRILALEIKNNDLRTGQVEVSVTVQAFVKNSK